MKQTLMKLLQLEVSIYVAFLALIIFIIFYEKIPAKEKAAALVIFTYSLTEISAGYLMFNKQHNIWLYNIMLIPQIISISYALLSNMKPGMTVKILFSGVMLLIFAHIVNIIYFQGVNQFANFTFIPSYTWLAVIAYYFLREVLEVIEKKPFDSLITWLAIATLIDNAASMPILTVIGWSEFITNNELLKLISIITWMYAFWYLIIIFGLLWTRTSLKSAFC